MRVVIYARVSSEKQEQEGTIESQLQELRKACKDHQIIDEYSDDGWSGEILARPELDRLRDDAPKGLFEAVYIYSPDRLARNLVDGILVKQELERQEIKVVFLNKDYGNDVDGDFYYKLDQLIAEKEKKTILERFRRGKLGKARMGMVVGTCQPYGYKYVKKTPERKGYYKTNPEEASAVKEIFRLYLEKQSILGVARELNEKGIYAPRKSKIWRVSTINTILKNESYIGLTYFNKHKSVEPKKRKENNRKYLKRPKTSSIIRDINEWIPIKILAIVDKDIFLMAQNLLKKNHKPYGETKHRYLLSGLLKCSCGGSYGGHYCLNYGYYRCSNRRVKPLSMKECDSKLVRLDKIENTVWSVISNIINHPKTLFGFLGFISNQIENVDKLKEKISEFSRRIEKENTKKDRLIELYQEGDISKEDYRVKIETINKKREELDKEKKNKEKILAQIENIPANKETIISFCGLIKKEIKNFSFDQKKGFLATILEKVIYSDSEKTANIMGEIPAKIDDPSLLWANSNVSLY